MKRILLLITAVIALTFSAMAQAPITKVDNLSPTDEIFMDLAVTAAKKSINDKGAPCGAVIIENGAWRSTGIPDGNKTAEEVALEKSRRTSLKNASIYTVNEPTTKDYNALSAAGVDCIYFVNPRDAVVAAGIYPASAYDDSKIDASVTPAPMKCIPFAEASQLIKK